MRTLLIAIAVVALSSCSKGGEDEERLPAAKSWSSSGQASSSEAPHAGSSGDPHAGVDMGGGDPHAGVDMGGGDPHAGLDMGGGDPHAGVDMGGGDPHAGLDMGGGDPAMAGLAPPDPNRTIDESKFLRGQIRAAPSVADRVKSGAILFLSARPVDPVTGTVLGQPLAVARIDIDALPVDFSLTGADSMVAGTVFEGDVELYARVDGDGEARDATPGDVEGRLAARIPAGDLELVLDTVVD